MQISGSDSPRNLQPNMSWNVWLISRDSHWTIWVIMESMILSRVCFDVPKIWNSTVGFTCWWSKQFIMHLVYFSWHIPKIHLNRNPSHHTIEHHTFMQSFGGWTPMELKFQDVLGDIYDERFESSILLRNRVPHFWNSISVERIWTPSLKEKMKRLKNVKPSSSWTYLRW